MESKKATPSSTRYNKPELLTNEEMLAQGLRPVNVLMDWGSPMEPDPKTGKLRLVNSGGNVPVSSTTTPANATSSTPTKTTP